MQLKESFLKTLENINNLDDYLYFYNNMKLYGVDPEALDEDLIPTVSKKQRSLYLREIQNSTCAVYDSGLERIRNIFSQPEISQDKEALLIVKKQCLSTVADNPTLSKSLPKFMLNDPELKVVEKKSWLDLAIKHPFRFTKGSTTDQYLPLYIQEDPDFKENLIISSSNKIKELNSVNSADSTLYDFVKNDKRFRASLVAEVDDRLDTMSLESLLSCPEENKQSKRYQDVLISKLCNTILKRPEYFSKVPDHLKDNKDIQDFYIQGLCDKIKHNPLLFKTEVPDNLKNNPKIQNQLLETYCHSSHYFPSSVEERYIPEFILNNKKFTDSWANGWEERIQRYPISFKDVPKFLIEKGYFSNFDFLTNYIEHVKKAEYYEIKFDKIPDQVKNNELFKNAVINKFTNLINEDVYSYNYAPEYVRQNPIFKQNLRKAWDSKLQENYMINGLFDDPPEELKNDESFQFFNKQKNKWIKLLNNNPFNFSSVPKRLIQDEDVKNAYIKSLGNYLREGKTFLQYIPFDILNNSYIIEGAADFYLNLLKQGTGNLDHVPDNIRNSDYFMKNINSFNVNKQANGWYKNIKM